MFLKHFLLIKIYVQLLHLQLCNFILVQDLLLPVLQHVHWYFKIVLKGNCNIMGMILAGTVKMEFSFYDEIVE